MDEYEEERIMTARRMAQKLARNRSRRRTVRKLPQSMVVVPTNPSHPFPVRRAINANKRLTYILLLGAVLCAYAYDVDLDTLQFMMQVVGREAQEHLPGVSLDKPGIPGLS